VKIVPLGSLVKIRTGKLDANASNPKGVYPFFTCSREPLRIDNYSYDCECVLVAGNGDLNVKYFNGKFDAYQRTYIIESLDKSILSVKYLYYFMERYVAKLRGMSIGGVIKYIKLNYLTEARIPLPNIGMQDKIVEILDKAQQLIKKRKAQIEALEQLTQSVFLEMFGDPVRNEMDWEISPLGNFLSKIENGWSPKCESFPAKEGKQGVLKLSAVTQGHYNPMENKALKDNTPFKKEIEVRNTDVLMTRKNTRELVGACAYVFNTPPNLMFPDTVYRLVFQENDTLDKIYLWRLMNNFNICNKLRGLAEGSSGSMPNISKQKLLDFNIIVPPIELQKEFSSIIQKIEEQKYNLNVGLSHLEVNFNSLMQRAFKGELFIEHE
jgi:type I restriction enzyme S subunit